MKRLILFLLLLVAAMSVTKAQEGEDPRYKRPVRDITRPAPDENLVLLSKNIPGSSIPYFYYINKDSLGISGGGTSQNLSFSSPNLSISDGNTVNLSSLSSGGVFYYDNVSSIQGQTHISGDVIITRGHTSVGDGGQGTYIVQASEPTYYSADQKLVVTVSGGFAVLQRPFTTLNLGMKNDGTIAYTGTDNSPLLRDAYRFIGASTINASSSSGQDIFTADTRGGKIQAVRGIYVFNDSVGVYSGVEIEGEGRENTQFLFNPSTDGTSLFYLSPNGQHYTNAVRFSGVRFKDLQMVGNVVGSTGVGTADNAFDFDGASNLWLENIQLNRWDTAIVIRQENSNSAYYNKIVNCNIEHVKQALYLGSGTAVTTMIGVNITGTTKFAPSLNDFAIVHYSGLTMLSCSMEGSSWGRAKIYSPIGRIVVKGGREEGSGDNPVIIASNTAINSGIDVKFDNGPTGVLIEFENAATPPDAPNINDDQNNPPLPPSMNLGTPSRVRILNNEDWKYGVNEWTVNGTGGRKFSIYEEQDRDSLFQAPVGLKLVKTGTASSFAYTQSFKMYSPTEFSVWVKKSEGAVLQLQVNNIYASDNSTSGFKQFRPIVKAGDWTLYYCRVSYYNPQNAPIDPTITIGLKTSSTTGSTATFCNLNTYVGGVSVFSDYSTQEVDLLSQNPTDGFVKEGQKIFTDDDFRVCNFSRSTNTTQTYGAGRKDIRVVDASGVLPGDVVIINSDLIQLTTYVDSVNVDTVFINTGVPGGTTSGNTVYIYRTKKSGFETDQGTGFPSPDANGDVTINHSLEQAPNYAQATHNGTTPYFISWHTPTNESIKFRITDQSGNPVTAGSVGLSWIVKRL